jgi:hypothetical protein
LHLLLEIHGGGQVNIIDYVQIMSTGNAVDFGDTIDSKVGGLTAAFSNGHGGL